MRFSLREHCIKIEEASASPSWFQYIINAGIIDFLIMRRDVKLAYVMDEQGNRFSNVMIDRGNG